FPWAVIEVKHPGAKQYKKREAECFCQAANTASVCLAMLANLAQVNPRRDDHPKNQTKNQGPLKSVEVQPVVCFTFIGSDVRVWIAYINNQESDQLKKSTRQKSMDCIWKGSLERMTDALQLCEVIDNLYFWALNFFRPWVSSCLDRWRYETNMNGTNNIIEESDEEESNEEDYSEEDYNEEDYNEEESNEEDYNEEDCASNFATKEERFSREVIYGEPKPRSDSNINQSTTEPVTPEKVANPHGPISSRTRSHMKSTSTYSPRNNHDVTPSKQIRRL
ncbi:hypothetical protein AOQ84DRAFT_406454, partial [Glonium stellatum]